MQRPPIVTGIMSFGMSGRVFHAPFLHAHPAFRLKAVVERTQKSACGIYPEIRSYESIDALLGDIEIELVVVNTPNALHFDHALAALKAGKHVLVEKPAVVTLSQLELLFAAADSNNCHFMVYQNRRWDTDYRSVCEVIQSGCLGKLIEVHFRYDRYKATVGQKVFKELAEVPGSGLVFDLGPHLLDQVINLFGAPLSSFKSTAINRSGSMVPDFFSYHFTYPEQVFVTVASSLLNADPQPSFIVYGTKGSYIAARSDVQEAQLQKGMRPGDPQFAQDNSAGKITLMSDNGTPTISHYAMPQSSYMQLFDAIYDQVANDIEYPVTRAQLRSQVTLLTQPDTV